MDTWLESFARANFLRSSDTAHDLKTPLNVAVLNLELLRMRLQKLLPNEDRKVDEYTRSIEIELRRMARIFDAFFLLSTPPKNEGEPTAVDVCSLCVAVAADAGYVLEVATAPRAQAHESRLRQAFRYFFEGASHVLKPDERRAMAEVNGSLIVSVSGIPQADDFEVTKMFKFYFTDADGNPDLSLAAARLIVETYGGDLSASQDRDKVTIRMTVPLGER